jgi:hypothetical protein
VATSRSSVVRLSVAILLLPAPFRDIQRRRSLAMGDPLDRLQLHP